MNEKEVLARSLGISEKGIESVEKISEESKAEWIRYYGIDKESYEALSTGLGYWKRK